MNPTRVVSTSKKRTETLQTAPQRGTLPVVIEGNLLKKGQVMTQWKPRWCSLEGTEDKGYWIFYAETKAGAVKGVFGLRNTRATKTHSKKNQHVLEITWEGNDEPRRFAAKSASELERWFDAVAAVTGQCQDEKAVAAARRRTQAELERQRMEVRVQLTSFKNLWMPIPVEGTVRAATGTAAIALCTHTHVRRSNWRADRHVVVRFCWHVCVHCRAVDGRYGPLRRRRGGHCTSPSLVALLSRRAGFGVHHHGAR